MAHFFKQHVPEVVFLLYMLCFAVPYVVLLPAGAGFDEPHHLARLDQLACGQVFSEVVGYAEIYGIDEATGRPPEYAALWGGVTDKALFDVALSNNLNAQVNDYEFIFPAWNDVISSADVAYGSQGVRDTVFSNAALNSPVAYTIFFQGIPQDACLACQFTGLLLSPVCLDFSFMWWELFGVLAKFP